MAPDEIVSLAGPVNTILKSSYLLGVSSDFDSTFQSFFDIAEEVGNTDCCAYIAWDAGSEACELRVTRHVALLPEEKTSLFDVAAIARHFGKPVHLDAAADARFMPFCEPWGATSLVAFPVRRGMEFMGTVVFGKKGKKAFSKPQIKLLWILAMQAESNILQSEAVKSLSFYSFFDPLTHLYNRRYFDNQLDKEIVRSWRSGKPFALLMLDIDGFKAYNDAFLHTNGDIALQELAAHLRDSVREADTVARYGGDEFAVIVGESTARGAQNLAARIADRFQKHRLPGADAARTERLSLSVGVALFLEDSFDKPGLLHKADRALYLAKRQGGGKVCLYQEMGELAEAERSSTDVPVQKIFDAARSVVNMDKFLEILLFTSMQGLFAERGSIVVPDPSGEFTFRAAIGFQNGEARFGPGTRIPAGPVTSWVVDHREPLVVSRPDDFVLSRPMKKNGYHTDSFICIPLLHDGSFLGAINLTNRKDKRPFTRDDVSAFQPIAAGIASILHKGMEFRECVKSFSVSVFQSLSSALELRYPFLSGHSGRVRDIALGIGERLGLGRDELSNLAIAAELHDIGIVGMPGQLLLNSKKLTSSELEIAQKHPFLGSKMLEDIPGLEAARRIILEHHEVFNGSGYPQGLTGAEISIGGRILAVAEFYDSIISERPHRGALTPPEARQLVRNNAGSLFDDEVCRAFDGLAVPDRAH